MLDASDDVNSPSGSGRMRSSKRASRVVELKLEDLRQSAIALKDQQAASKPGGKSRKSNSELSSSGSRIHKLFASGIRLTFVGEEENLKTNLVKKCNERIWCSSSATTTK